MLAQRPFLGSGGQFEFPGAGHLYAVQQNFGHKRTSTGSASSIASVGPPTPPSFPPNIATNFYDQNYEYMHTPPSAAPTSKSLPTPSTEQYMYQPHSATPFSAVDMRRIHSAGGDDNASYVSSMSHNSPSTPHTNYDMDYDESKNIYNGETKTDEQWMDQYLPNPVGYQPTAAFQQSLQDVFPDQPAFQNPMAFQQMTPRMNGQQAAQNMMMNRLQAARQDHLRTSSPVTSNPRERSPFRQNSPLVMAESMRAPTQRPQQQMPTLHKTRTSVSPKELMIDEHDVDDAGPPLFQDQTQQSYRGQPQNISNWYTPSLAQEPTVQIPQQYPFVSQQSQSRGQTEQTPEFPAHLISMESTQDDGPSEPSSQQSQSQSRPALQSKSQPATRPADTSSDAGTYTCTYHGCTLRFETPAKLQKHKREGHRQHSPTHSQTIAERNSQAGPHKCERINPSTGKPCNSIFSRPYDLTRHEDTIHNNRKMKVRCHLCTEEKTFSRNDALTRHMRVVHPDVEFTGKPKKHSNRS